MGSYISNTPAQQLEMLRACGFESFDEMFECIPNKYHTKKLDIPEGVSESQAMSMMEELAEKNKIYKTIFRGAGAYDKYVPAIVKSVISKENFLTAYTPYQAEISQGILQSIFEYQTVICRLTGLDAANAGVYDGATACAEGVAACAERNKRKAIIIESMNPMYISTVNTYCFGNGIETVVIPCGEDGTADLEALESALDKNTCCVLFQSPNYFGCIENAREITSKAHASGAKVISCVNPVSLAMLETPGEYDADLAVGEGQVLGLPLAFGGPYLGFMAAKKDMIRKMPGRIVGQTTDGNGNRAFVLTLQAREQHIRREKASSNICSNQALCALAATVYVAAMGEKGLYEAANSSASKAHYLADKLSGAGLKLKYTSEFFNEFVTVSDKCDEILSSLDDAGILGGLKISENELLWCCTEKQTKDEIDKAVEIVKGVQ